MPSRPEVSVVIPTRDRAGLVLGAVHTAATQQRVDVEVIVVDDGSTCDVAGTVGDLHPDVTVLRNDRSEGVSAARNRGIAHAGGEWVAFLDDDDLWAPDKLVDQLACLTATGRDWCYTGAVSITPDLRIVHGTRPDAAEVVHRDLPVRNRLPAGPSNVVVRRALLAETGAFDVGLRPHADWDQWIRLARTGPPARVERPLVGYTLHEANMSVRGSRVAPDDPWLREVDVIERRYADLRAGREIDRGLVWRWLAGTHLRRRHWGPAAHAYARAIRAAPAESLRLGARALASTGIGPTSAFRARPDEAWRRDAERWLAPLRDDLALHRRRGTTER